MLEPWELAGVLVGHSAHVSVGGYIPAAPYAGAGSTQVMLGWFEPAQLALLDATEPNYERRHLDAGVDVYVSRWGVIAVGASRCRSARRTSCSPGCGHRRWQAVAGSAIHRSLLE